MPTKDNAEEKRNYIDFIASGQAPEKRYGFYNESEIIENLKKLSRQEVIICSPNVAYLKENGAPVFYTQDDVYSFQLMKMDRL